MEKFPAVFEEARRKPLKIGILEEVMARGPRMSKKHARLSLAYYTRHLNYQRALLASTQRYDLDGQPCGEVTEAQKETAKRHIKRVHEHWKKRKQQKKKQRPVKQTDAKPPQHSVQDPAIEQGSTSTMNPKWGLDNTVILKIPVPINAGTIINPIKIASYPVKIQSL